MVIKSARKKTKITRRKQANSKFFGILSFILFFTIGLLIAFQFGLFGKKVISPLPQAVLSESVSISSSPDKSFDSLTFALKNNDIAFTKISKYDKKSFLVKLSTGEEIIFSLEKGLDLQTSSLQLILSRLTIEGKRFSRLDFRFEKPVITLK